MKGQHVTADQAPMIVGNDAACDVVIQDTDMAHKHAVIEHTPEGLFVRDLNSMNKILVNKREVREKRLKHGDQIELGRTRFLVQARVETEVAQVEKPSRVFDALITLSLLAGMLAILGGVIYYMISKPNWTASVARVFVHPTTNSPALAPTREPGPVETNTLPGPVTAPMATEIENMRKDLGRVREAVRQAMIEQGDRKMPAPPPTPTPILAPTPTPDNSLRLKTQSLFKEAQTEAARRNFSKADQVLFSIQMVDPDFLPAYEARARLFERRELPAMAIEQWAQIIARDPSAPLARKATEEMRRLRKLQPDNVSLPRRVKIVSAEQTKLLGADDVDEMRTLTIRLEQAVGESPLPPDAVHVTVAFFDRDRISGEVNPTKALAPREPVKVSGAWSDREQKTLSVTYVRPIDLKVQEARAGKQAQFYGFWLRVYCRDQLQDEYIKPNHLLQSLGTPVPNRGSSGVRQDAGGVRP